MNPKLTVERLRRRALVYVRQSTPGQVLHRQESQRLQYGLVDRARGLGFSTVGVIDDDLGRSASGLVDRPGFQRLVAEVCTGDVGAVFCVEASRLARNGRDWHHLIELCGMVGAVLVDFDGVYDPNIINDRLLLGLKGTMSEFELSLFRQRSQEAIRQKAGRGELRFLLPAGFYWNSSDQIEKDPDQRVQQAIQLVFSKMLELGSARQTLFWFRQENVPLPVLSPASDASITWKLPSYHNLLSILTNPVYAGAYAFGKRERRTKILDGRLRKTGRKEKSQSAWTVLIRDHHSGYVSWEQYERYQAMLAANAYMKSDGSVKSGRGGGALLSGLLRCRRCGRIIHLNYSGSAPHQTPRYDCNEAYRRHAQARCIAFSGLLVDEAVANEVLGAIEGNAIEAALVAAEQVEVQRRERRKSIELELEQAGYEARLAARRYEAVDPDQRLVAAELEARWNSALERTRKVESRLQEFDCDLSIVSLLPSKELLLSLAQDLPAVWNAASTDMRLKQRIVRILIQEIMADVDEDKQEVVLLIHWAGGRHSELRVKKRGPGNNRWRTQVEAMDVVRQMAGKFSDEVIASTLNRLRLRTGTGYTWDKQRVYSLRQYHELPGFDPSSACQSTLTLRDAARRLNVSPDMVRRMIAEQILPASQVVATAPWEIPAQALDSDAVRQRVAAKNTYRPVSPRRHGADGQQSMFSES